MTSVSGHGNVAGNVYGRNSRTHITNNVNVQGSHGSPPLPPDQLTLISDDEVGPHAGWYLASAIITVAGGLLACLKGVWKVMTGGSEATRIPASGVVPFPIPPILPWALLNVTLIMVGLVAALLYWRARDEAIPISTGRLMQHRHIGGSESHRLRVVRTQAVCPRCKRGGSLRFERALVTPGADASKEGSAESGLPKEDFVARCVNNSHHRWLIDKRIVSDLVDHEWPTERDRP